MRSGPIYRQRTMEEGSRMEPPRISNILIIYKIKLEHSRDD